MKTIALIIGISTGLTLSVNVKAETNIPFTSKVTELCEITVHQSGLLKPNIEYTELSSLQPGGQPATASIEVNAGNAYEFDMDPVADWAESPTLPFTTAFAIAADLTGVTSGNDLVPGETVSLEAGKTDVTLDLTASGGFFEAGIYKAYVTFYCGAVSKDK